MKVSLQRVEFIFNCKGKWITIVFSPIKDPDSEFKYVVFSDHNYRLVDLGKEMRANTGIAHRALRSYFKIIRNENSTVEA